jgi:hypothetical protein
VIIKKDKNMKILSCLILALAILPIQAKSEIEVHVARVDVMSTTVGEPPLCEGFDYLNVSSPFWIPDDTSKTVITLYVIEKRAVFGGSWQACTNYVWTNNFLFSELNVVRETYLCDEPWEYRAWEYPLNWKVNKNGHISIK